LKAISKKLVFTNFAKEECHVLLLEPRGVINTDDTGGDLTAYNDIWI